MQRSPGRPSWTGPLERPWKSWITSFLIPSLSQKVQCSSRCVIWWTHRHGASDAPGIWSATWSKKKYKNMASFTAPKPNYRCMFRCREQFIRSSGAFAIRDCNQVIVLFWWFILFLRCMLQNFVHEIIFFFKFRNSSSSRGRDVHNGPSGVTNEEQRTWNTHTANLDNYDACGFRLLIEIW